MAYPDIVALLRAYLLPIVAPRPVASRVPDPRPAEWVQLRRIGGQQERPVRDRAHIDVWAWSTSDPDAWALADLLRRSIHALAGTTLLGPPVYRVEEVMGPRSLDDPQTGAPRMWATYALSVRADDAIAR